MKVIIAGGGTGGHIFPALAIAEEIMNKDLNNEILFVGTKKGMEKKLVGERGFDLSYIKSAPIMGKGIVNKIKGLLTSFLGMIDSFRIIKQFKPDVVIGVGGYVSGPVVFSSYLLGIPRAICEQNSIPGLTNRLLGYFVQKIFISFECSRRYFSAGKVVLSGNPIRSKIAGTKRIADKPNDQICILIIGGSQGAHKLNEILPRVLNDLKSRAIRIIHQTGAKDYRSVLDQYSQYGLKAEVYDFINDMEKFYAVASLVIARSGAGTVAEICAIGIPSILIPFPYATHNHQYHNARALQEIGASVIIEEKDLSESNLCEALKKVINHEVLKKMSEAALSAGMPQASSIVVNNIYKLVNNNV